MLRGTWMYLPRPFLRLCCCTWPMLLGTWHHLTKVTRRSAALNRSYATLGAPCHAAQDPSETTKRRATCGKGRVIWPQGCLFPQEMREAVSGASGVMCCQAQQRLTCVALHFSAVTRHLDNITEVKMQVTSSKRPGIGHMSRSLGQMPPRGAL